MAIGALASKDSIKQLLGPTFEWIGEGIQKGAQKGTNNVVNILTIACNKIKEELKSPGQINPRVFKNIVDEGRFVEDVFASEYFGGLLAASRSEDGQDDSLLPQINIIKNLSSNQIRLHFLIYRIVAMMPHGRDTPEKEPFWENLVISVPTEETMSIVYPNNTLDYNSFKESIKEMERLNLFGERFSIHSSQVKLSHKLNFKEGCLQLSPNEYGAGLFLKALGFKSLSPDCITSVIVDERLSENIKNLKLPKNYDWKFVSTDDPIEKLHEDFESRIYDVESTLENNNDDIKDKIEELNSELNGLKKREASKKSKNKTK